MYHMINRRATAAIGAIIIALGSLFPQVEASAMPSSSAVVLKPGGKDIFSRVIHVYNSENECIHKRNWYALTHIFAFGQVECVEHRGHNGTWLLVKK